MSGAAEPNGAPAGHSLDQSALDAIARQIRARRQPTSDWEMRTSELLATTVRRTLNAGIRDGWSPDDAAPRGLISTIIRRVIIDRIRRRQARRAAMEELARQRAATSPVEERQEVELAESRDAARALLESLGEQERQLIQLRMSGLGWQEVAAHLRISPDAARQRWAAMRTRARDTMSDRR